MRIAIKNGRLVNPEGIVQASIIVESGKISAITSDSNLGDSDQIIDAKGNYVIPGVIDPHSHLAHTPRGGSVETWEDAYKRQIGTETSSAAAGGVTTFFTLLGQGMWKIPLDPIRKLVEQTAMTDMSFHRALGTKQHFQGIPEYLEEGISSFKLHMTEYPNFGILPADDWLIYLCLQTTRDLGYPALTQIHCENLAISKRLKEKLKSEGSTGLTAWSEALPAFAEQEAMARVIHYAEVLKAPVYIPHIGIKEGCSLLAEKKARGAKVIGETCPHYLALTKEHKAGLLAKVNPPLRDKEDVTTLWRGLETGIIDCIGSDHVVSLKQDMMELGQWDSHNVGFAGTETLLPVLLSEGVNKGRISLESLVKVCSTNTAKVFGLYPKKGILMPGSDADLTIIDLGKEVTVTPDILHTASDYTVFDGLKFRGWPILTILRGNIIMQDGQIVGKPGLAKVLPRKLLKTG